MNIINHEVSKRVSNVCFIIKTHLLVLVYWDTWLRQFRVKELPEVSEMGSQ